MKNLLRLEELAQFLVCVILLASMDASWWIYLLLLIGPDVGMVGYSVNSKVGALTYNLLHHKAVALLVLFICFVIARYSPGTPKEIVLAGIILYGHASMDRILGYGLKFGDNFHHTHLGWIGKGR